MSFVDIMYVVFLINIFFKLLSARLWLVKSFNVTHKFHQALFINKNLP